MTSEQAPIGVRPKVLVLDVNETLSDMSPMADLFTEVGAPAGLAATWFAGVLRDGFALAAAGTAAPFADVAAGSLRVVLDGLPLDRSPAAAVDHLMDGFTGLSAHADVPDGIRALAQLGIRLVTLGNGSVSTAASLLERAGVRDQVELLLTVEDAGRWKPAPAAYAHALARCGVEAPDAMLVAVHPWDVDGASRAGLATAWVDRNDSAYPEHLSGPDLRAGSLTDLADQLGAMS